MKGEEEEAVIKETGKYGRERNEKAETERDTVIQRECSPVGF